MADITICVASKEVCNKNCKRRNTMPDPICQSYADFSIDFIKGKTCEAFIGYGKRYKSNKLKINWKIKRKEIK